MRQLFSFPVRPRSLESGIALLCLCWMSMPFGLRPVFAQTPARHTDQPVAEAGKPSVSARQVEEIRKGAAKACGIVSDAGTWRMQGTAHFRGADQTFEILFDNRMRFRMTMTGALQQSDGFDGAVCWTEGPSEAPHRLILHDRDMDRLIAWTMTGLWSAKSAPLRCELASSASPVIGKWTVSLKPKDGILAGAMVLDAATLLPDSVRFWTDSGDDTWTFADYRAFGGRMLPTHILHKSGTQEDKIEIVSAERVPEDTARYRIPKPDTTDVLFDASADNGVEIKRIAGLVFVHPKVDGQDVGWFFLDTGADDMCLDPGVAKKLALTTVGGDTTAGVVGVTHLDICRATTFQLGPLTLRKPVFLELDMAAFSQALKLPLGGICGYDFLARAALDIDPKANKMRIFQPGAAPLPSGAKWTKIGFESNTPCLVCPFAGDYQGYFSLDTGSTSTVDFFTPAVEKFHLLDHQDGSKGMTGGAGGTAENRQGKIDWFKLGGTTFEKPNVAFQLTKTGVFASPYRVGNIGMGFLGRFRLVLDYSKERIAFLSAKP